RVDENDNYRSNEPFMASNGDFRRPIDLAFGPDGAMYMLEYGSVYGVNNEDARLVKITYNAGNRPPLATARIRDARADSLAQARSWVTSDRRYHAKVIREVAGAAPLEVSFAGNGRDPDEDDTMSYEWLFDGNNVAATSSNARHVYTEPGSYNAVFRVRDRAGEWGSDTLLVRVGNEAPEVAIETPQNKSFFWEGEPFDYSVTVADAEDGDVDPSDIVVEYAYFRQPDQREVGGDRLLPATTRAWGETLIAGSDCKACHTVDAVSAGPSFTQIAERYKTQDGAIAMLAGKIVGGGGGNWGEVAMSAHPQLTQQEAEEIVRYVFSLTDTTRGFAPLPSEGSLTLEEHSEDEPLGRYVLRARYTDRAAPGAGPLTVEKVITLRPATVQAVYADEHTGFPRWGNSLSGGKHKSHVMLRDVDLTGIAGFTFGYDAWGVPGEIEVRIDSYAGPVIGRAQYVLGEDALTRAEMDNPVRGSHDVYFIVRQPEPPHKEVMTMKTVKFEKE
ncbi:MAG TPA: PKD domain-containing protein, partial [Rhodothermales bacterium]|nr:PKD domain-containing protein [Rhodothermales bacterium]